MKYRTFYQIRHWVIFGILILLFLILFRVLAFCDPCKLPGLLVWPHATKVSSNFEVLSGSVAYSLYMLFGYGVWFLIFGFAICILRFVLRDKPRQSSWRFFGFCVALTVIE